MMIQSVSGKLWHAFRQAFGTILRASVGALLVGGVLVEGLGMLWNVPQGVASGIDLSTWPPIFHVSSPTLFVHLLAVTCGLLLASLVALTVAVVQTLRGVLFAAEHVDDVAGAVVEHGLEAIDATVDTLDGPNRYGFRGKRGQAVRG